VINIKTKSFDELSTQELYEILSLRQAVFIVEQDCPYLDVDGLDKNAIHISLYYDYKLAAYARIIPKGLAYPDHVAIGRVVSSAEFRGQGYGKLLFKKAVQTCKKIYTGDDIKLSSQTYIQKFYADFGFKTVGLEYLEDGIPHIAMVYEN
jgi:ElaA protein